MMHYGAAYDADGALTGVYSATKDSDLFAQAPPGGRIYPVPLASVGNVPFDMAPVRAMLRGHILAARDAAQQSGCETPFGQVDTDSASQLKIIGAVVTAQIAPDGWSIEWTMKDNSVVTLAAADMIAVGLAVSAHVDACHQFGRTLSSALDAAETIPAAYAVIELTAWPA